MPQIWPKQRSLHFFLQCIYAHAENEIVIRPEKLRRSPANGEGHGDRAEHAGNPPSPGQDPLGLITPDGHIRRQWWSWRTSTVVTPVMVVRRLWTARAHYSRRGGSVTSAGVLVETATSRAAGSVVSTVQRRVLGAQLTSDQRVRTDDEDAGEREE